MTNQRTGNGKSEIRGALHFPFDSPRSLRVRSG